MSKRLILFSLFLLTSSFVYSKTLQSVAIAPQGAVIVAGTSIPYTVVCTYSDASTDGCAAAGGATWTSPTNALSVTGSGGTATATWSASSTYDPHNTTTFPSGMQTAQGAVIVTAGGLSDRGQILAQSTADTFAVYTTPASNIYTDNQNGSALPINVVVGSTVAIGAGFTDNNNEGGASGNPFQFACNWSSSNTSIATVTRFGLATAVAPGSVTITCGTAGDGVYTHPTNSSTTFTFTVVAPTVTSQTWYVRPDGGTPYVNSTQTPAGQCSGKVNAAYPGSGVNQPCAMGNLRYLWTDQVTSAHLQWMIGPGDTVIVAQNSAGYNLGMDAQGPDRGGSSTLPINCAGSSTQCYMPTIPSGTAAQHTRILGANYASCHADSAKTQLNASWATQTAFNVKDSQFVDIGCFVVTQASACANNGSYTNKCTNTSNFGDEGIWESALTASVTYTDIFVDGLAFEGVFGATGAGVSANYLHIRAVPSTGISMDDAPWLFTNISVAGGFTMTNSITEFTGCVEEKPVVHNYPYIECRDQELGGQGDGFGTGSTTGTWVFDHDIWRYNYQDGLDLLHSNMQSLTVTNNQSYGNDGQPYKLGASDSWLFQNNLGLVNCNRLAFAIGDEPASAIVPGVNYCRAGGDWVPTQFAAWGTYTAQNNTLIGYGDTPFDEACSAGSDNCSTATTTFQNNVVLGYSDPLYTGGTLPGSLFTTGTLPANQGWTTRSNNLYFNVRTCPATLLTGESCNTHDALLANEPASPISVESALDNYNFLPSSSSPLIGAGVAITNLLTDNAGVVRPNPPSIGGLEYAAGTALSTSQVALTATPNPVAVGQSVTLTASIAEVGSVSPTGTVTFFADGTSLNSAVVTNGVATLSLSTLAAGTHSITATYTGDSTYAAGASSVLTLTVNAASTTATKTALQVSSPTVTAGQAITLTAAVTAVSGTPTGTVSFLSNGVVLGSASVNSSGVATWPISSTSAGSYTLTAQYAGTSTFAASTSSAVTETVNATSTTATKTALQVSSPTVTAGQAITLTAAVTAVSGTPTGTVSFLNNGVVLGSASVSSSGIATWPTSSLAAGSYTLTAQYAGTSTFAASASPAVTETVNPASATATKTALQVSPTTIVKGEAVTLTATVTAASGVPTGTVSFLNNGVVLGSAPVSSSGVATWPISSIGGGSYALSAQYTGTSTFAASASAVVTGTAKPGRLTKTTSTLQVSPNPITEGQAVTLTATVTASSGVPTGTVSFLVNGTVLGSATLNNSGVATWPISSMATGSYTVSALYAGTSTFEASDSSVVTETVNPAPLANTATSLQVSPNPVPQGQAVTLTATVTAASGIPAGTVSFFSNGTLAGSAPLTSQGVATYTALSLPAGTYQLTAQYSATANFSASTSPAVSYTVTAAGVNLALSTSSVTVASGAPTSNSVALTLTPVGGYTGTLQMACVTPPAGTTCSFQPQTVTVNSASGPTQVGITVQTTGKSTTAALRNQLPSTPGNAPAVPASIYWIPGLLAAALIGKERKRLPRAASLLLLLILAGTFGALTGCGSGITEILPSANTVALKVMVTGTGNVAQSITLTVTSK